VLDRSDFAAYDRLDRAHLGYALRTCLRPRPRLESFERVWEDRQPGSEAG